MATTSEHKQWFLQVVRGRDVGRRYPVGAGETTIGNALAGASGFDLSDQESNSPRRMAGQHACLLLKNEALSVRDLDSPGGTFVNRQRLLAGQMRLLDPGDVIQLGGVQLEVKREVQQVVQPLRPPQPSPVSQPPPLPPPQARSLPQALTIPFPIAGGSTCRSWDDFLTLAAQRWALVRDELTSGRIAAHLTRAGRPDLVPRLDPRQTPDEQLDTWLARLPASRSSDPELDVHPPSLLIRAATGGGVIRKSLRITNVGYRLLRITARVEPATCSTIQIASELATHPFLTIDQTDIPVAIELPVNAGSADLGTVVIESNGGTRRVKVLLERPVAQVANFEDTSGEGSAELVFNTRPLGELITAQPIARRLILVPLGLLAFRLLVLLAGWIPLESSAGGRLEPRLASIALVLAAAGAVWGGWRGGMSGDRFACGFAAAMAGVLTAAVGFAFVRSVESLLGDWASSPPAVLLFWALLGLAIALLSWLALPPSRPVSTPPMEPSI